MSYSIIYIPVEKTQTKWPVIIIITNFIWMNPTDSITHWIMFFGLSTSKVHFFWVFVKLFFSTAFAFVLFILYYIYFLYTLAFPSIQYPVISKVLLKCLWMLLSCIIWICTEADDYKQQIEGTLEFLLQKASSYLISLTAHKHDYTCQYTWQAQAVSIFMFPYLLLDSWVIHSKFMTFV